MEVDTQPVVEAVSSNSNGVLDKLE